MRKGRSGSPLYLEVGREFLHKFARRPIAVLQFRVFYADAGIGWHRLGDKDIAIDGGEFQASTVEGAAAGGVRCLLDILPVGVSGMLST